MDRIDQRDMLTCCRSEFLQEKQFWAMARGILFPRKVCDRDGSRSRFKIANDTDKNIDSVRTFASEFRKK